jgi:hypothetical protein
MFLFVQYSSFKISLMFYSMWCEIEFKYVLGGQKYSISTCDDKEKKIFSKGLLREIVS